MFNKEVGFAQELRNISDFVVRAIVITARPYGKHPILVTQGFGLKLKPEAQITEKYYMLLASYMGMRNVILRV